MTLIQGGIVHDGRGHVGKMDVALENGRIAAVGPELAGCDGAEVIDASGCHVFPGFVSAVSTWGIAGPGWTGDDQAENSDPVTPQMDVTYAFDQDSMNFQKAYRYGVTSVLVTPRPINVLCGQAAVYKTAGKTPHGMLIKEKVAMMASVSAEVKRAFEKRNTAPMTHMGIFSLLKEQLEKAKRYDPKEGHDEALEALLPVLTGKTPLLVNCCTRAEAEAALHLLSAYPDIRIILSGAYGLDETTPGVQAGKVSVFMGDQTEAFLPDNRITQFERIIPLMESGCPIAISCGGNDITGGRESLLWNALFWVRHGLSPERAVSCITSVPADILGLSDRVGSIAPGLDADLSIWSDDPFVTYAARVQHVFLSGTDVFLKEVYPSCW